ncbi:MAG: zinc ABC transporter substrate-binding protein [Acidilobaceae archaeon]|nr:zinc ABC transporter substrate-binding protein [Acidilobaceae archaeon]MCX8166133.1 zinc ABC transporter substrate-binding protein [Acidilobaceae archaeon]MDW7974895.1 zinc ABC transporter substrate-binding protein [Sulfolobales archaeon]
MDASRSKVHEVLSIALLLLIAFPLLSAVEGIASQPQAQPIVTISVVPPVWARVLNIVGSPFVRAVNPVPEGVDPHHYEPKPEDIERALRADLVVVDSREHLPMGKRLVEAARERGVPLILVEEDARKRGWRPLLKPSGAENLHVHFDANATLIMVDMVVERIVEIARAKGVPQAQLEAMRSALSSRASLFKAIYLSSITLGKSRAQGMEGVALYSSLSQYLARDIGITPVVILLDEHEEELKPRDLERLKASGAKCMLMLEGPEHFDQKVVKEISELGVRPVIVKVREVMGAAGPHFLPAVAAEALAQGCSAQVMVEAHEHEHQHIDPLLVGVSAYALAVTLLAAFLLLRRK